jgi:FkbM family methyltransferase
MTMISYAQDCEDVLLQRAFPAGYNGFYVDVGAGDPEHFSVTKHFYDHGWRGVNVEPLPDMHKRLCAERPRDINLNLGLADRVSRLTFYEVPERDGWSTFSSEAVSHRRALGLAIHERDVIVTTLAQVCEEHITGPIDFLKVDVEGLEREVLAGADWSRWRPRVVVIENTRPEACDPILIAAGYLLAFVSTLNRVYVREEDSALRSVLAPPVGPHDQYVLIEHVRVLCQLNREIERDEVGPNTLRVACRLHRLAARHPKLAAAWRRARRRAG